ncbi:hypothetical protein J5N58_01270 [Rhizobium cremeum]|uniref:hypothetical protein n=1 Tax=Rhizobium cremeum TaxID=2813827 RepID=UPI001FD62DDA|nr:hypothetical protein [Rhizobium cremeum]MCJ7993227.1 hypothetical protein [Rhizobium cremeum]MCJ7998292.1 hypothetical protein [Rhizobium cremeum]
MKAIDRTTKQFVASLRAEIPDLRISVERSKNAYGQSNYVHIRTKDHRYWKVRISDHPVGMRRAKSGREDLYIWAGSWPPTWAVWLGQFRRTLMDGQGGG